MSKFVHLHLHSHFSVLDGLGKVPDIVGRAVELGMEAVAISDHASISAMPELVSECKAAGIKPIVGCEFYVVDKAEPDKEEKRRHLSVWPKNWNGVQSVMRMLTTANRQFYKRPRITFEQALGFEDCFVGTACSFGILSMDDWRERVAALAGAYGEDLYFEVMPHMVIDGGSDMQALVNKRAIELYDEFPGKLLATTDAHYVRREDAVTHEVLLAIQTGKTWEDPARWRFGSDDFYMQSQAEVIERFVRLGYFKGEHILRAIVNTSEIAEAVDIQVPDFPVELPAITEDSEAMFARLVGEGWHRFLGGRPVPAVYRERLVYELEVIRRLGFVKYFLIVWDVITWARGQGIMVGPGRGSAAGSLVSYLLGITQVDPIKHGLYFERFLNPERVSMPDIDVDFADDRREEVFAYIRSKYGHDFTANINTFGMLTAKSAFRDVARVFSISPLRVNALSKQIEDAESFDAVPEVAAFARENPAIVEHARKLAGTIRQSGVHACGIVVSSRPLQDVSVVEHRNGNVEVVNWDMRKAEKFGLLKIDILGLTTLTILNKTLELLGRRGIDIDLVGLPLDDAATLAEFSAGNGLGVFQFENSGMCQLLRDINANTFEAITDCTALYRPGSLNSGQTARYVAIAKGHEYETYPTELLRPILGPTRGQLVYQEQIMRICADIGGFSWAEADAIRKIIGKKLGAEEFEKHREHFVNGCKGNDVSEDVANTLFTNMVEFAAYSFNKSHALAYTVISYWCMWLKVHHTLEYMAAYLSTTSDDRFPVMVKECERLGILVKRPDINISGKWFEVDYAANAVVAPLGSIKGVGSKAVDMILEARAAGPFTSFEDFVERVNRRVCNVRVQQILVRAGCFEELGLIERDAETRVRNYAELLPIFNAPPVLSTECREDKAALAELFGEVSACAEAAKNHFMRPVAGKSPCIMVINNNVKLETEHLSTEFTKSFLKEIHSLGLKDKDIYYTGALKCYFNKAQEAPKECAGKCIEYLRREIRAVKPKVIVVFASQAIPMFTSRKPVIKELNGQVEYNKEFGAYVLYSFSPQYGAFNEAAQAGFKASMATLAEIFGASK